MTEILGYLLSVIMGFTLGLLGGGGSILTVPILVYVMGIDPVLSTAYSLFVVGLTALIGAYGYWRKGQLSLKTAVVFAIPAFASVYATRKFLMPAIPDTIAQIGSFTLTKDILVMVVFAAMMIVAAVSMIRKKKGGNNPDGADDTPPASARFNYPLILAEGVVVGVLTGFVGAGGGFLIIPALVVFARLPMKLAVGTSLLIIAVKSLIGFIGDVQNYGESIDWVFLGLFSLMAIAGILLGTWVSKYISGAKLKPAFGWFVLVMGIFILLKETLGI